MNTRVGFAWAEEERQIDRGVVTGVCLSAALILLAILFSGRILNYIDIPAFMIVCGGTFGATLVHFPLYDIQQAYAAFRGIIFAKAHHPAERIDHLVQLAQRVRQSGLLTLEREAEVAEDPFLRTALQITVDGQPQADVKRILETEIRSANDRAGRGVQVFQTLGNYAPALGLIGTLLGLIQMLGTLDNPAKVGPAMSTALLTTLYGAVLANLIFLPIAGKLRTRNDEECLVKAITLEGILSIGRQENPLVIEQRLQSFLPLKGGR